jgi:hypothetical protein
MYNSKYTIRSYRSTKRGYYFKLFVFILALKYWFFVEKLSEYASKMQIEKPLINYKIDWLTLPISRVSQNPRSSVDSGSFAY